MKALQLALAGVLMLCAVLSPALAKTVITNDPGGSVVEYISKYSDMRDANEHIVIDGKCISACTLMLGILPSQNICVTSRASFGFHSASYRTTDEKTKEYHFEYAPEMTRLMFGIYPGKVRNLIRGLGWDGQSAHPAIIYVNGVQLNSIVRPCGIRDLL